MHGSISLYSLLSLTTLVAAQQVSPLRSCADVHCPIINNTATASCSVAGTPGYSYPVIGLASYDAPAGYGTLAWTVGVGQVFQSNATLPYSVVHRDFYLGVSPQAYVSSNTSTACAFFFTTAQNGTFFYDAANNATTPTNCIAANSTNTGFQANCVAVLKTQAQQLATVRGASCESIAGFMQDSLPAVCNLPSDTLIHAVPLSGSQAPSAISAAENTTSNCWPTLPKSNALIPVFNLSLYTNTQGLAQNQSAQVSGTTPILNLFFDTSNSSFAPVSDMVCLRVLDRNDRDTQVTRPSMAAPSSAVSGLLAGLVVALGLVSFCS